MYREIQQGCFPEWRVGSQELVLCPFKSIGGCVSGEWGQSYTLWQVMGISNFNLLVLFISKFRYRLAGRRSSAALSTVPTPPFLKHSMKEIGRTRLQQYSGDGTNGKAWVMTVLPRVVLLSTSLSSTGSGSASR